jgi:nucleotide-binding universal stress UspA family protein
MKPTAKLLNGFESEHPSPRSPAKPSFSRLRKILAATDLSARAEKAVIRAAKLTTEHDAFLEILYVGDSSLGKTGPQRRTDAALRETMIKCTLPSERYAIRQAIGKPVVEIVRRAREAAADLIIAGDHETNVISDVFSRTTAEAILRESDHPVLIVKRRPRTAYRRVLVPVDFSDHSRSALEFALGLVPDAKFQIMHAYEGVERQLWRTDVTPSDIMHHRREFAKTARAEMRAFLGTIQRDRSKISSGIWFGRAPHVIELVAERFPADLVVVGSASRRGLSRFFLGSVAEYVMRHVEGDVLVVRSKRTAIEINANRPDAV